MVTQYREFELLEKMLKRDSWTKEEACWFFLGLGIKNDGVFDLESGAKLSRDSLNMARDDFSDLTRRWSASKFEWGFSYGFNRHDTHYCIVWAQDHGVEGRFHELIAWGEAQNLIQKERLEQIREEMLAEPDTTDNVEISRKELNNRNRLIGVLVDILSDDNKKQRFSSDEELKGYIEENYSGQGLSRRTLDSVFPEARSLVERR